MHSNMRSRNVYISLKNGESRVVKAHNVHIYFGFPRSRIRHVQNRDNWTNRLQRGKNFPMHCYYRSYGNRCEIKQCLSNVFAISGEKTHTHLYKAVNLHVENYDSKCTYSDIYEDDIYEDQYLWRWVILCTFPLYKIHMDLVCIRDLKRTKLYQ